MQRTLMPRDIDMFYETSNFNNIEQVLGGLATRLSDVGTLSKFKEIEYIPAVLRSAIKV